MGYANPREVVTIRVIHEKDIGDNCDWAIDGLDAEGRYTEQIACGSSREEVVSWLPQWAKDHGFPDNLPLVDKDYTYGIRHISNR